MKSRLFGARIFVRVAALGVLVTGIPLRAQESSLSISAAVDSLQSRLLRAPSDRSAHKALIEAYTLAFQPELALLEILYGEQQKNIGADDPSLKGRVQLSLEQIEAAQRSLQQAYLLSPTDETLLLIGVLEYSRGTAKRGSSILQRLRARNPQVSVELLRLYEQFYLNGRKVVASAVGRALQDLDPGSYAIYFPEPEITIFSPTQFFSTEASQTSVIWEVRHRRPIQKVSVGDEVVFERSTEIQSPNDPFQQNFTRLVSLREGRNDILVRAEDIFGNVKAETVVVNGLDFRRFADWSAPAVDSLRKAVLQLRTYVPDSVLAGEPSPNLRVLCVGGGADEYFEGALFLFDFLIDRVTGLTNPSNAKLLVRDRTIGQNISVVMDEWLLKGATFRSVSLLYFGGDWNITPDAWYVRDRNMQWFNVKPYLENLRSLASAGVILLFDGVTENRPILETSLREVAASSAVPVEALILPAGGQWKLPLVRATLSPATARGSAEVTTKFLHDILPTASGVISEQSSLSLARNPAVLVQQTYARMLGELEKRLAVETTSRETREKLMTFARDWRRFHEVARFLDRRLTLSDFIVRVDEYRDRVAEAE